MKLATHLKLIPKLRMHTALFAFSPHISTTRCSKKGDFAITFKAGTVKMYKHRTQITWELSRVYVKNPSLIQKELDITRRRTSKSVLAH
jgi:hypothetical protein